MQKHAKDVHVCRHTVIVRFQNWDLGFGGCFEKAMERAKLWLETSWDEKEFLKNTRPCCKVFATISASKQQDMTYSQMACKAVSVATAEQPQHYCMQWHTLLRDGGRGFRRQRLRRQRLPTERAPRPRRLRPAAAPAGLLCIYIYIYRERERLRIAAAVT